MSSTALQYLADYKKLAEPKLISLIETEQINAAKLDVRAALMVSHFRDLAEGGKRLRGALTVLAYELAGQKIDQGIIQASLAMELFHAAILVQDDVMDGDPQRRGVTTIHSRYPNLHLGEAVAVCASDVFFGVAFAELASLAFPAPRVLLAIKLFAEYYSRLGLGQSLDVMGGMGELLSPTTITKVIYLKSAEYTCIMPLMLGATLADAPAKFKTDLEQFGANLGWAFQIQDDILGMFGQETGKPVGSDLRGRKQTLLFNEFLVRAAESDKAKFLTLWGKKDVSLLEIQWVQSQLEETGSLEAVKTQGIKYVTAGKKFVSQLTTNQRLAETATDLLDMMMQRMS